MNIPSTSSVVAGVSPAKHKFPAALALEVAQSLISRVAPACERIEIAGSLRRGKQLVGDIEILYVPKMWSGGIVAVDLFGTPTEPSPLVDIEIGRLENNGMLERRKNIRGNEAFGEHIKLMFHTETNIPVDLFATSAASWFNYLVCRTGGAASNTRIAALAKSRGYKWRPYTAGFEDCATAEIIPMDSEEAVFRFVGLPYEAPHRRP